MYSDMICTIENGELLRNIVETLKELSQEVNFDFSSEGLHIQAMDSAHVSLCSLVMRTMLFKQYICGEPISLGVRLNTLSMALAGVNGEVTLKSVQDKLEVTVKKMDGTSVYTLHLMDIDCEIMELPSMAAPAVCVLPSKTFGQVVRDLSNFSDTCSIEITDRLHVKGISNICHVSWKSESNTTCKVSEAVHPLQFALRYLCIFSKASTVSPKVIVNMVADSPICFTYPIAEGGHICFYLAPKMND